MDPKTQSPPDSRCPRCGGSTAPSTSGRITQWVFACTCAVVDVAEKAETEFTSVIICQTCGKRLNQGRVGSFTQWVFRSDLCSCETPAPIETQIQAEPQRNPLFEVTFPKDISQALEIEPDKFPVERYRPLGIIGKGASGVVYLAADLILDKRVAIKTLHSIEPGQLVSFQQEAKTTSSLNHDNIVTILDFGATGGGVPYMVMELINGLSLEEAIEGNGPLSEATAAAMARQVCMGLAYAHEHGVLHRDLKSSNILMADMHSDAPNAKIIDFGVAGLKFTEKTTRLGEQEQSQDIVGSPLYMPPDQPRGLPYDERSEIYSLGCCLFEALTGTVPFHGESALETLSMHAEMEPPRLSAKAPDRTFNEQLEQIVQRCLQKNPAQRYATAQELATELGNLIESGVLFKDDIEASGEHAAPGFLSLWPAAGSKDDTKTMAGVIISLILFSVAISTWMMVANPVVQERVRLLHYKEPPRVNVDEKVMFGGPVENEFQLAAVRKPGVVHSDKEKASKDSATDAILNALPGEEEPSEHPDFQYTTLKDGSLMIVGVGGITDQHLAQLAKKNIQSLALLGQKVTGTGLKYLRSTGITNIQLDSCPVTDEGMKEVGQLKTLRSIQLRTCPVTDKGVSYLENLPLTLIILRRTPVTNECIKSLAMIKTLDQITLYGTAVTMEGIMPLTTLPKLRILDIANIRPCPGLEGIEKFKTVIWLDASDLAVNDAGLARAASLPLLYSLKVNRSAVTDVGVMKLKNKKSLLELHLAYCENVSPTVIQALRQQRPNLKILYRKDVE